MDRPKKRPGARRRRAMRQEEIQFRTHGGRRDGAGRKPNGARAGVSHGRRPKLSGREPVLVTLKMLPGIWNLRSRRAFERLVPAFSAAAERFGTRLVHFSVQRDHIHFIAESVAATALSRAMQGLGVRIVRAIQRLMGVKGTVFADRYHEVVLATPRQVRHALRYVLLNAHEHGEGIRARGWIDPYSSGAAFDGWTIELGVTPLDAHVPVAAPRTWLLRVGWRRAGPAIDPLDVPGARAVRGSGV